MSTSIVYIFAFAYYLLHFVEENETNDLIHFGLLWLSMTLLFELGGSLVIEHLVEEILIGWNVSAGYMWPYVLLAYLSTNLIVGTVLYPGKR